MIYSTASLVASASICTKGATENTTVEVKKGDTLTDVVLQAGRHERTIATATVKGFTVGDVKVARGETTIWDGIPVYRHDVEGDAHFGTVDEILEVRGIVVEIPAEEEGGKPTVETLRVANIKSITAAPAEVTDQSGSDLKTDPDNGGEESLGGE